MRVLGWQASERWLAIASRSWAIAARAANAYRPGS